MSKPLVPKLQTLRLDQIRIDQDSPATALHVELTDAHLQMPGLAESALDFLQWTQPIVLTPLDEKDKTFKLIAGYRTYRILCGTRAHDQRCQALVLPKLNTEQEIELGIFDAIAIRAIEYPYAKAAAALAGCVKSDPYAREIMSHFSRVEVDDQIAALFGLGRTTLNEEAKKWKSRQIQLRPNANRFSFDTPDQEPNNVAGSKTTND